MTRIETDKFSDRSADEMVADGFDISGVTRDPVRKMGLYLIDLNGSERSFHYWRQKSAARRLADDAAALEARLEKAGLIHLSGITLAILAPSAQEPFLGPQRGTTQRPHRLVRSERLPAVVVVGR